MSIPTCTLGIVRQGRCFVNNLFPYRHGANLSVTACPPRRPTIRPDDVGRPPSDRRAACVRARLRAGRRTRGGSRWRPTAATRTGNAAADVEHPAITARLLHDAGCDETVVATAVLHDVIEDTGLDPRRDRRALRRRDRPARGGAHRATPSIAAYAERKRELRARGIAAGREVAAVMAADKLARATRAAGGRLRPEKLRHFQATLAELREAYPDLPLLEPLANAIERLRPTTSEAADGRRRPVALPQPRAVVARLQRARAAARRGRRPAAAGAREVLRDLQLEPRRVLHGARRRRARPGRRRDRGDERRRASPPPSCSTAIGDARARARRAPGALLGARRCCRRSPSTASASSRRDALDDEERAALDERFRREVFPALTPLAVGPAQPFPYISNLSLSLGVLVRDPATDQTRFARVKVPKEGLPRFVAVGDGAHARADGGR